MPILQRLSKDPPTPKSRALSEYVGELRKAYDRPEDWTLEELADLCGVKKITLFQLIKDILSPDYTRAVGKTKVSVYIAKNARKIGDDYSSGKHFRSEARATSN